MVRYDGKVKQLLTDKFLSNISAKFIKIWQNLLQLQLKMSRDVFETQCIRTV